MWLPQLLKSRSVSLVNAINYNQTAKFHDPDPPAFCQKAPDLRNSSIFSMRAVGSGSRITRQFPSSSCCTHRKVEFLCRRQALSTHEN